MRACGCCVSCGKQRHEVLPCVEPTVGVCRNHDSFTQFVAWLHFGRALSKGAYCKRAQRRGQRLAQLAGSCFPTKETGLARRSLHWAIGCGRKYCHRRIPSANFRYARPMPLFRTLPFCSSFCPKLSRHIFTNTCFPPSSLGRIPSGPNMDQGARRPAGEGEEETVLPFAPGLRRAPNPYLTRAMASSPVFGRREQQQKASTTTLVRTMPLCIVSTPFAT